MRKFALLFCFILSVFCLCGCLSGAGEPAISTTHKSGASEDTGKPDKLVDPAAKWRKLNLAQYSNADAVLLDDIEFVEYNANGTYTTSDESWTLIRNAEGRDKYRNITLHFNDFYQNKPVVSVEIIKPDGSVVKPVLQKKISVESSQMQANIYDPANKVMSVGIPGLNVGDILHCKYTEVCIRPRMQNVWCTIALLQSTIPVLHYSYTISAPEKSPLAQLIVKDEVKNSLVRSEKKLNGRIIYRFEASDVPQILPEPDMPPWYLHGMRILASTAPDWQFVSRWYYNLCAPHIKAVSPELTAKARILTEGKSEAAAIRAVFDFVSKEIRYTGVTNENTAPGYEPHDVKDTFAQKHGVCRDKAALLAAMLIEAGFDAFPVLFMAGDPKDPEVPNNYFNHAITGVKTSDNRIVLMDPTDENSSDMLPAYAMDKSFLCAVKDGDVLRRSPVIPAEKNNLEIKSQGFIDEKFTLRMKSVLTFYGFNDNIYRQAFVRWPENYREQFAAAALKSVLPGAVLEKMEILPEDPRNLAQPFKLILTYFVSNFVDIKWGDGLLNIPFIGGNFGAFNFMVNERLLKKRQYPMRFDSTAAVSEECVIALPAVLESVALPGYRNIETDALKVNYNLKTANHKLYAQRVVKLEKLEVSAEKYHDFMKAVEAMQLASRNKVIVRRDFSADKKAFAGAQAVILEEKQSVEFADSKDFTCNVYKKIKVLNYGGVKNYSELKLNYIEKVSQAYFTAAKVTSPDGRVLNVDLNTVKIMDQAVSQGAPRYPAARQLILPLPGVEPGCVIEYSYSEKFHGNHRAGVVKNLAGFMPVKNSTLQFSYPAKLEKKFKLLLPDSGFVTTSTVKNGLKTVSVKSCNIPMYNTEPFTPPITFFAPSGGISSFDTAQYAEKLLAAFKKAAANAPAAEKLAADFVRRYSDIRQRVRAIRDFVAENIRRAGLEVTELGLKYISPADITLSEGYGNSIDRAVLLYSLLKASGINNIAVVMASALPDLETVRNRFAELPRNYFDTALLRVTLNNEEFYLGDTDKYNELGAVNCENALALQLDNGELITVESSPGCNREVRQYWRVKCLPDQSVEITRTHCYYGSACGDMKRFFDRITPEKERQYWEQQLSGDLAGAEILEIKKEFDRYPGVLMLKVKIPYFWKKSADFVYFNLPDSGCSGLIKTAGKRTLPYMQNKTAKNTAAYEIELLKDWKFCELTVGTLEMAIPGSNGIVSRKSEIGSDHVLRVTEKVFFQPFMLDVAGYGLLENIQKELSDPANRTILFKTSGK